MKIIVAKQQELLEVLHSLYQIIAQCMYVCCMYVCVQCIVTFYLYADQGVPGLSVGSNITIRILPSDDAFGVFLFSTDSLSRLVAEQDGGTAVSLTVNRLKGSFDDVSVYWEVEGGGSGDISPVSGQLDFPEGETERELTVTINNDQVHNFVHFSSTHMGSCFVA